MKYLKALVFFSTLIIASANGFAETQAPAAEIHTPSFLDDRARPYGTKCMEKLDFGTQNFMTGWTKIITVPADKHAKKKGILTIASGIGEGFILGGADTVGGFFNAVTFPVTAKIALPKGGVDIERVTGSR